MVYNIIKLFKLSDNIEFKENSFKYFIGKKILVKSQKFSLFKRDGCVFIINSSLSSLDLEKTIFDLFTYKKGYKVNFYKRLVINGVGYRFLKIVNDHIRIKAGFSNDVKVPIPPLLEIIRISPTSLLLLSPDYNLMSLFSSILKNVRSPDIYKGKGIKYFNDNLILKNKKGNVK